MLKLKLQYFGHPTPATLPKWGEKTETLLKFTVQRHKLSHTKTYTRSLEHIPPTHTHTHTHPTHHTAILLRTYLQSSFYTVHHVHLSKLQSIPKGKIFFSFQRDKNGALEADMVGMMDFSKQEFQATMINTLRAPRNKQMAGKR